MFVHVFFMFPETAGKTLEETEAMFEDPNGIKYLGTPAWKTSKKTSVTVQLERGNVELAEKRLSEGGWEAEKPAPSATEDLEKAEHGTREVQAEETITSETK